MTPPNVTLPLALAVLVTTTGAVDAAAQGERFTERDVRFRSGPVELAGTIMLPAGGAEHGDTGVPGVVFIHGSGGATRAGARAYAEEFARLGVASLFFDKRGSGESGGSWLTASLDDLADDALAAIEALAAEERVDGRRIGLWGVSQAGWVAPMAAARSDRVAFLMIISGGGASPRESELFSFEHEFDRAGLTGSQRTRAREILNQYYDYLATGDDRAALRAELDALADGPLAALAEHLDGIFPSEENRSNWAWVGGYDPGPDIARVTVPVLLLFGGRDTAHPTGRSVERWRDGLAAAGNEDVTIVVFPDAGHGIRMRHGYQAPGRAPFADGYGELQLGWLWQHVVAR